MSHLRRAGKFDLDDVAVGQDDLRLLEAGNGPGAELLPECRHVAAPILQVDHDPLRLPIEDLVLYFGPDASNGFVRAGRRVTVEDPSSDQVVRVLLGVPD